MKWFILINCVIVALLLIAALIFVDERNWWLYLLIGLPVLLISDGFTAYFYFKRGKIYEDRGQSGPDG